LTGRITSDLKRAVWRYRKETRLALSLMVAAKLSIAMIPLVLKHIVDELGRPITHALWRRRNAPIWRGCSIRWPLWQSTIRRKHATHSKRS
jgi:hypothetical protein